METNELLQSEYRLGRGKLIQHAVAVGALTDGYVRQPRSEGDRPVAGVLMEPTLATGEKGRFQIAGIAKLRIAETVQIGDRLIIADAEGRVKPKPGGGAGADVVGRALGSSQEPNNIVKCILCID